MSTTKKVILITGGNTGLGLEIVKALYKSPHSYEIVIGSRNLLNADKAIETVKQEIAKSPSNLSAVQVDLASDEVIKQARDHIAATFGKVDVLVNNAGGGFDRKIQDGSMSLREAWNTSWDTNVAGTMVITSEFISLLLKSSDPRLMFMTSGTSTLVETENFDLPHLARINASPEAGWPKPSEVNPITSYRSTKTGLNMAMRQWHRLLKNDGVKVWAISPGFLVTGLGGVDQEDMKKMGALDASVGGNFVKEVVEGKYDEQVGKVIRSNSLQPW